MRLMLRSVYLVFMTACLANDIAFAYEPDTHGHITYHAFANSILCNDLSPTEDMSDTSCDDNEVLQSLDLRGVSVLGGSERIGRRYYDFRLHNVTSFGIKSRSTSLSYMEKEGSVYKESSGDYAARYRRMLDKLRDQDLIEFSPIAWAMRGAIREDDIEDTNLGVCKVTSDTPKDDPYGTFNRVTAHFYDPVNDADLGWSKDFFYVVEKNPAWALGAPDPFRDVNYDATNDPVEQNKNHFTVKSAREAMYRALTGRSLDSGNMDILAVGGVPLGAGADISFRQPTEEDRKAYWATTFRSLGDVMHLIEDMAQPQHTRLDPHSGACAPDGLGRITGHASVYEVYIGAKSKGLEVYEVKDNGITTEIGPVQSNPLNYFGHPVPVISSYEEIWSSVHGNKGELKAGTGLADYTNKGFFTYGKNLGGSDYDLPSNDASSYETMKIPSLHYVKTRAGEYANYTSRAYLIGDVHDARTEQKEGALLTMKSVFTVWADSKQQDVYSLPKDVYTMDTNIYESMAQLTLPRAVAYSAAFLNYFFRGKLEIAPPDDKVYSIIDTSEEHSRRPEDGVAVDVGGNRYGFTRIKLKVRNASPVGENMEAPQGKANNRGHLRIVVKYKLNHCYFQDMSGEFGETGAIFSGCDKQDYWSSLKPNDSLELKDEKIAVSKPVPVSTLSRDFSEYTFVFENNDILPVNAHSLKIQVVYRGWLGNEADAVVATTLDVPEPTYIYTVNNLDFQCINGENDNKPFLSEKYKDGALYGDTQHNDDLPRLRIYLNDSQVQAAELDALKVAQYSRLAALLDGETYTKQLKYVAVDPGSGEEFVVAFTNSSKRATHVAQRNGESELYTPTYRFRGIYSKGVPGLIINGSDNCPTYAAGGTDLVGSMPEFAVVPEKQYLKNLSPIGAAIKWN